MTVDESKLSGRVSRLDDLVVATWLAELIRARRRSDQKREVVARQRLRQSGIVVCFVDDAPREVHGPNWKQRRHAKSAKRQPRWAFLRRRI